METKKSEISETKSTPKKKDKKSFDKWFSIGIFVTVLILSIIYVIFIFECYHNKILIFKPYVSPPLKSNAFYPLGTITALTPQQIQERQDMYNDYINQTS